MPLTVQNALELDAISRGTVVAGHSGLSNVIESVTVLEIPDATDFLEPNLLALTSFYAIADNLPRQISTVRLLHKHHAAGLLMFNVGREGAMAELPEELCRLCDELGLPLILMPMDASYYSVFYVVMDRLLNTQAMKLANSMQIYESYINQLLNINDTYSSLLSTLSRFIQCEVALFNHNHKWIYPNSKVLAGVGFQTLKNHFMPYLEKHEQEYSVKIGENCFTVIPVMHKNMYCGSIVIANIRTPISELDRLVIVQTQKALCITVFNTERLHSHHQKLCYDFILDLLVGNYSTKHQALSQARELGLEVEGVSGILVAGAFDYYRMTEERSASFASHLEDIYAQAQRIFAEDIVIKHREKGQVVVLTSKPNASEKYLPSSAKLLLASLDAQSEVPTIGIGPACAGLEGIPFCYEKAVSIMHISDRLFCEPRCASYDVLEVYDIIFKSISKEQAKKIAVRLLAPVRLYDNAHNAQLEQTFAQLILGNKSTVQVAEEMFIHKNTVLQRRIKIQSLYSFDPFSPDTRLQFEIAFLLRNLFDL